MVLQMQQVRQHHLKNVGIVILLYDAQNANTLFTAATSQRKQETVTSFDSAYARVIYILHSVACARVCIDFFSSLVAVVRWLHISHCRDNINFDIA